MAIRSLLMIIIAFLSLRECSFPIKLRQWCRNEIGVFPLRINQSGFCCFNSDFSGLQLHQDLDHDFDFSKGIMVFQSQIWDPGDANQKMKMVEHDYGIVIDMEAVYVIVPEIVISDLPCSKRLTTLYIGTLILSFNIRETLVKLKSKTRNINHSPDDVRAIPPLASLVHVYFDGGMTLRMHQSVLCLIGMTRSYVGLVQYQRRVLIDIEQTWRKRNATVMFKVEPINRRRSGTWHDSVKLYMALLKRITKTSTYFGKTLVRKFWCHCVYISDLVLGTSILKLRLVKRNISHKLLHPNRNKAKSNMKLENNGSYDRLASKATLRKHCQTPFYCISLNVWHIYLRM